MNIEELLEQARTGIAQAGDEAALDAVRVRFLGKKGELTALLKSLGALDAEERPKAGAAINRAKEQVQEWIAERRASLGSEQLAQALASESVDVTLPGRGERPGGLHPVTQAMERIEDIFTGAGYSVVPGQEKPPFDSVIEADGEDTVKPVERVHAPARERLEYDLGITRGAKFVARAFQLTAQLTEIVNLTVEDDRDRSIFAVDWLVAAIHIDDTEPTMTEPHVVVRVDSMRVRPSMCQRIIHALQDVAIDDLLVRVQTDAADSTHQPLQTVFAESHSQPVRASHIAISPIQRACNSIEQ